MRDGDLQSDVVQRFNCGQNAWETQISDYLTQGNAWREHKPPKSITMLHFDNNQEEQIIGFYNIAKKNVPYPKFDDEGRLPCFLITHVGVAENFKRQGKLRAMMRDIATAAIESALQGIYLFVDTRNETAIAAYESLGFVRHMNAPLYVDEGVAYQRMLLVVG